MLVLAKMDLAAPGCSGFTIQNVLEKLGKYKNPVHQRMDVATTGANKKES